jgi:peptidoglycan hydrolase-like protein with peptidoglycan-binding domain
MKYVLALCLACSLAPVLVLADEETKQIQESLKAQGFFYGDVTGNPGEETTQAIRRFQIRNALAVTGQLDDATRSAIESGGQPTAQAEATPPAPPSIPQIKNPGPNSSPTADYAPPPIASSGRPDLRADPSAPAPVSKYPNTTVPGTTVPDGMTAYRGGNNIFTGGPFAGAPPFVQSTVLGKAQVLLTREGFYNGPTDGMPGQQFAESLLNYQTVYNLPRSARLDASTVAALGIGPVGNPARAPRANVPRKRAYSAPQVAPGVYEGRIVPESAPR